MKIISINFLDSKVELILEDGKTVYLTNEEFRQLLIKRIKDHKDKIKIAKEEKDNREGYPVDMIHECFEEDTNRGISKGRSEGGRKKGGDLWKRKKSLNRLNFELGIDDD